MLNLLGMARARDISVLWAIGEERFKCCEAVTTRLNKRTDMDQFTWSSI